MIVTLDGREVYVPNSTVVGGSVTNLTSLGARLSELTIGVAYGSDLRLVKRTIIEAGVVIPFPQHTLWWGHDDWEGDTG